MDDLNYFSVVEHSDENEAVIRELLKEEWPVEEIEDIIRMCRNCEYTVLSCCNGYVIFDNHMSNEYIHVVVAVGKNYSEVEEHLVKKCKSMGARGMTFTTHRRGWEKLLTKNWKHLTTTWEMKFDD